MLRWWIISFIIPLPFLLTGIMTLNLKAFDYNGIDNLTIAGIMFAGYVIGIFIGLLNYAGAGMLGKKPDD